MKISRVRLFLVIFAIVLGSPGCAQYGPIALPCSGPMVVSIFALSFTVGEAFNRLWIFLLFGLGLGLPLLMLSLLSGMFQYRLTTLFARHSRMVNFIGGLL